MLAITPHLPAGILFAALLLFLWLTKDD